MVVFSQMTDFEKWLQTHFMRYLNNKGLDLKIVLLTNGKDILMRQKNENKKLLSHRYEKGEIFFTF